MTNVSIIDASIEDLPNIVKIYNSTVAGRMVTADTEEVSVQSREKWFYEHNSENRPIWIMKANGQMAGWLSFQSFHSRPAYFRTAELSIYMDQAFRKKGLANTFLQKALQEAPSMGIKTLLGLIFGHNQPSLNLFYKYGFTVWGNFPKVAELDGVERDLLILGKRIVE